VSRPLIRAWYAIAVSFFACLVIALAGVGYTNYVQKQAQKRAEVERQDSDRRWCALLSDLDSAYRSSPRPTSETGKKVAAEIHKLRVGFGCPER
jgi:hypothetical protein